MKVSNNSLNIRKAKLYDVPTILQLCEEFLKTTSIAVFGFDRERTFNLMVTWLDKPPKEAILLVSVDQTNKVVGVIGGYKQEHHFAPITIAQEYLFCGTDSLRLINTFEQWAKWVEADFITLSTLRTKEELRLHKIYKHKGWSIVESSLLKEIR